MVDLLVQKKSKSRAPYPYCDDLMPHLERSNLNKI